MSTRGEKIQTIREFPVKLRALLDGLSENDLTTEFLSDEWTVAQVVHHCADSHMNSIIRLKLMLTEDKPPLKGYSEKQWALLVDGNQADLEPSLKILEGLHTRWVQVWESLSEAQWQRTGIHSEFGEITLDELLDIYDDHCRTHIGQIERVLAARP
jgi:hypothetical protein